MKCLNCGFENSETNTVCSNCGQQVVVQRKDNNKARYLTISSIILLVVSLIVIFFKLLAAPLYSAKDFDFFRSAPSPRETVKYMKGVYRIADCVGDSVYRLNSSECNVFGYEGTVSVLYESDDYKNVSWFRNDSSGVYPNSTKSPYLEELYSCDSEFYRVDYTISKYTGSSYNEQSAKPRGLDNEEVREIYEKITEKLAKKYGYTYYDRKGNPYWYDEKSGHGYTITVSVENNDDEYYANTYYYTDIVISYGNPLYGLW